MAYELPKLPYAFAALEPHIDARTMEIHHGKHHNAYVTNANNLLKDHAALAALDVNALIADLSKVPEAIRGGVRNNAGGHSNHAFYEEHKPLTIPPGVYRVGRVKEYDYFAEMERPIAD